MRRKMLGRFEFSEDIQVEGGRVWLFSNGLGGARMFSNWEYDDAALLTPDDARKVAAALLSWARQQKPVVP